MKPVAYPIFGDISCYADCSNARQKVRLAGETLKGLVVVPSGRRDWVPEEYCGPVQEVPFLPRTIWGRLRLVRSLRHQIGGWGRTVSNELTFFEGILLSLFSGVKIVLFCWDPPGNTVRNRSDWVCRFRSWLMDLLMNVAVCVSSGMILNLHPGFLEGRCWARARKKIHVFPNGTTLAKNIQIAAQGQKVPKRFGMACRINELKGCWDAVNFFVALWQRDPEVSLLWVGGGKTDEVKTALLAKGIPARQLIFPGDLPREKTLPLLATCSFALNFYPDVPSLRWNYLLKAPEFLSMGLPVVTNDLPGIGEYVKDGVTGVVFPTSEIEVGVEKTLRILADPQLEQRLRAQAESHAANYDWLAIHERMAVVIRDMLAKCGV